MWIICLILVIRLSSNMHATADDLAPTKIHSHNDYLKPRPLFDALIWKCGSLEADVWLRDGALYVAHEEEDINTNQTLSSLYLEPLKSILTQNMDHDGKSSIYPDYPEVSLQFLIESKYPTKLEDPGEIEKIGIATVKAIEEALKPLNNWLTSYSKPTGVSKGPITAVLTGNSPVTYISQLSSRSYFCDAPLSKLVRYGQTGWIPSSLGV
ncbi:Altered inheritance of mitochondria protein 6 [Neolecta irregularis DAH-3]|uniref:Altered inheritance of mitochondria protein 6 n=1 Tax=Neolecta irregularis (strain DAH-3) TaxID=1198029 RepID=A0A1U7LP04_NEOID|nr:Altered inheritance of mitochondria protein 6 [Neolecta irregularis DAH-3]|eukprot:OLL24385.1 Altered inheritance of mitochondria protein 6 [Neolecta irregularis DAH-3]